MSARPSIIHILVFAILVAALLTSDVVWAKEREKTPPGIGPAEVGGWIWDGVEERYNERNLFDFIDGAAELYLAYNFRDLTVTRYRKNRRPLLEAQVYRMGSTEDAFGIFTFERQDPEAGIGQGSEFGGGMLRFWKGDYFVSVFGEGEGPDVEAAVLELGQRIASSIKGTGDRPRLLRYLPPISTKDAIFVRSHVLLNQRLFISRGNILQLDRDVKAVIAPYAFDKIKAHLLIVQYPSENRAISAFDSFRKAYTGHGFEKGVMRTENGKWTKAARHRECIVVAFAAPGQGEAEKLVEATIKKVGEDKH